MSQKPTYEELEKQVKELEKEVAKSKHAKEALQENEAELFAIYNNSPIIMFLVDENRRVLKANQLALEATGRQYDEIVGLRGGEALGCIHAAADPAGCGFGVHCEECIVRNTVLDSLKTGRAHHNVEAPVQIDLGDGVIDLYLLVSTSPLNAAGTKSVLVCLENITERKQAEEALRKAHAELEIRVEERTVKLVEKNEQLKQEIAERKQTEEALQASEKKHYDLYELMRLITDNVPDLIWAKDMDDRFIFVNQAICDKLLMCGNPDKAIGKTDMFFAEQERKAGYKHTFGEVCANSDAVTKERKTPDHFLEEGLVRNEYLVLDVYKAPFLNEDSEMIGTVGCC